MKATARRFVTTASATHLADSIVSAMMKEVNDPMECICTDDWHGCSCASRFWDVGIDHLKPSIFYSPDHYGASVEVHFYPNQLEVYSNTCGGHGHDLSINLATGELRVTHEGARSSVPGLIMDFLPDLWWELNRSKGWKLVEHQSSQPSWAVEVGLLQGRFGHGPAYEYETSGEPPLATNRP